MSSATETFAVMLARASRQANRFLRSRRLDKAARDDVIAAAVLWCWENRDNYSLTATLEVWFLGAVRNAYRDYRRGEMRDGVTEIVENMGAKDDPAYNVMLQDAVKTMAANMDETDRAIVRLTLDGKNQREVSNALQIGLATLKRRLTVMRDQIPESAPVNVILRRVVTPPLASDDGPHISDDGVSNTHQPLIDKEIVALDFPPPAGKECPPCWRCRWYDGFMPGTRVSVRMQIQEAEVRDAVANTEARKIEIAQEVRDGSL